MKDHRAKDKILTHLLQTRWMDTERLSDSLNIKWSQAFTCCQEMQLRGHVQTRNIATVGHSKSLSVGIEPAGEHFLKRGDYTKEHKRNSLENFPKRYWWIIAIFSFLIGLFTDVIKTEIKYRVEKRSQLTPKVNNPHKIISDSLKRLSAQNR